MTLLPIPVLGLTCGVIHHWGGGHLTWEEAGEEQGDAQPLLDHITAAAPASQDSLRAESFLVLLCSRGSGGILGKLSIPVCEFIQPSV